MKPTITEEAFRKALADQFRHAPDGALTSEEISDAIRLARSTALVKIRAMIKAGTLEFAGKVRRPRVTTGELQMVPAYRMTGKAGKK